MTDNTLRNGGDTDFQMSVLTCDQCGKKFVQELSLYAHQASHD